MVTIHYKSKIAPYVYIAPAVLLIVVFVYNPLVQNVILSTFEWSGISRDKVFVGLENYRYLFEYDVFWTAFKNNMWYAVISLVFQVGLALVLAAVLEEKFFRKFQPFLTTVYFLPSVLSVTIVGFLWGFIYNPGFGLLNQFLRLIGLASWAQPWLANSKMAMYSIIAVSQWQYTGYCMVFFLIAIQNIPQERYEAAEVDGAGPLAKFLHITLPGVKEMLLVVSIFTINGAFRVFNIVEVMTQGGPNNSTQVLGSLLYQEAFWYDRMGLASAISTVIFAITLAITIFQLKTSWSETL